MIDLPAGDRATANEHRFDLTAGGAVAGHPAMTRGMRWYSSRTDPGLCTAEADGRFVRLRCGQPAGHPGTDHLTADGVRFAITI